jgi:hypothetical protein
MTSLYMFGGVRYTHGAFGKPRQSGANVALL